MTHADRRQTSDYIPTPAEILTGFLHPIGSAATLRPEEWERPLTPRTMLALLASMLDEAEQYIVNERTTDGLTLDERRRAYDVRWWQLVDVVAWSNKDAPLDERDLPSELVTRLEALLDAAGPDYAVPLIDLGREIASNLLVGEVGAFDLAALERERALVGSA